MQATNNKRQKLNPTVTTPSLSAVTVGNRVACTESAPTGSAGSLHDKDSSKPLVGGTTKHSRYTPLCRPRAWNTASSVSASRRYGIHHFSVQIEYAFAELFTKLANLLPKKKS